MLILTGAGEGWPLRRHGPEAHFRELENKPNETHPRRMGHASVAPGTGSKAEADHRDAGQWLAGGALYAARRLRLRLLRPKTPKFGLSEVNWGILPGGLVSKALQVPRLTRDALYWPDRRAVRRQEGRGDRRDLRGGAGEET